MVVKVHKNEGKNAVVYNSYKFHSKTQEPNESFDNYLVTITELAKVCEFESLEERMIRDKIIVGIYNSNLREKLLSLDDPRLENVIKFCRVVEGGTSNQKLVHKTNEIMMRKNLAVGNNNGSGSSSAVKLNESGVQGHRDSAKESGFLGFDPITEIPTFDIKKEMEDTESDEERFGKGFYAMDEGVASTSGPLITQMKIESIVSCDHAYALPAPVPKIEINCTENDNIQPLETCFIKVENEEFIIGGPEEGAGKPENFHNYVLDCNFKTEPLSESECNHNKWDDNSTDYDDENSVTSGIYQKCYKCSEEFNQITKFQAHLNICQNLDETSQDPQIFENYHIKVSKNYIKKVAISTDSLQTPYKCSKCGKCFKKEATLRNHMFIHTNNGPFKCDKCDKTFGYKSELRNHSVVHSNAKPFKCSQCDSTFKEMKTLKFHSIIHTGHKPFKCEICDKAFARKFYLEAHSITHTGQKPYLCKECNKSFGDVTSLKRHALIHTGEKPYKCNDCDRSFRERTALRKHLYTHTTDKPYKCKECGKEYAQKGGLLSHSFIHTGQKPHECEVCKLRFRDKASLKSHSFIHSGEYPFKCTKCPKAYRDNTTLKRHLIMHAEENPFKCNICHKTFRGRTNLRNHNYIHSGEKPYECNECSRAFRSKSTLKEHLFRIHQAIKDPTLGKSKKLKILSRMEKNKEVATSTSVEDLKTFASNAIINKVEFKTEVEVTVKDEIEWYVESDKE